REHARVLDGAYAALLEARQAHALLLLLHLEPLRELLPLVRRHLRKRLLRRLLVDVGRQLRGDLLVALPHFLIRVTLLGRPLLVAVHEVLIRLLLLSPSEEALQ